MSIIALVNRDHRVLVSHAKGVMTDDLLMNFEEAIRDFSGLDATYSQLADARDTTENHITPRGLQHVAQRTVLGEGTRRAIVVSGDLEFAYARMYGSHSSALHTVTRDLDQAITWLGVPVALQPMLMELQAWQDSGEHFPSGVAVKAYA